MAVSTTELWISWRREKDRGTITLRVFLFYFRLISKTQSHPLNILTRTSLKPVVLCSVPVKTQTCSVSCSHYNVSIRVTE